MSCPKDYGFEQEIEVNSEEEIKELKSMIQKSIFRPVDQEILNREQIILQKVNSIDKKLDKPIKTSWFKKWYNKHIFPLKLLIHKQLTKSLIKEQVDDENNYKNNLKLWYDQVGTIEIKRKRFNVIHNFLKTKLMYPILNFIAKKGGKYLVQTEQDIPAEWYNNHVRMFYHSFEQGYHDMWYDFKFIRNTAKFKEFKEDYTTFFNNDKYSNQSPSYKSRIMALNIAATEICEDTVDREWLNMSVLRLTHSMMQHYGVSTEEMKKVPKPREFPVYDTSMEHNPKYFFENRNHKVWQPNKDEDRYKWQRKRTTELKITEN